MIYNIVLNSLNRIEDGISPCNATYNFDWTILPDSKFKMTWSFVSTHINSTSIKIALLSLDLGQIIYQNSSQAIQSNSTLNVGVLIPYEVSSNSFLYADKNLNQVIVMNRPRNNRFAVKITTNDIVPSLWTDTESNFPDSYMLILNFEEI